MKNLNIVFVDSTQGYPYKISAANTKMELIAKGLVQQNSTVTFFDSIKGINLKTGEYYNGAKNGNEYYLFRKVNLAGIPKNIRALNNILKEKYRPNDVNVAILSSPNIFLYFIYLAILKANKYKSTVIFHEWHISYEDNSTLRSISYFLYDHLFGYFCSAIFPISSFLQNKCLKFKKKMLLIPILADFDQKNEARLKISDISEKKYFLYCGNTGYFRVLKIVIDAYSKSVLEHTDLLLKLVLHGTQENEDFVKRYIEELGLGNKVIIQKNLPFDELIAEYKSALALLIPLSNDSLQDKARFSQKIAEYLSSKRPIITVAVGEINHYFIDKETAFIAPTLSVDDIHDQMQYVLNNKKVADFVGKNGNNLGIKEFDYIKNSTKLKSFLLENLK